QPTPGTYTISDLSGRIIQQGTLSNDHLTAISVASLASGIYLLKVGDVERITTTRFLKVH
ncbi:MAG: T9SS type A sorting domain-containing protein, partial [Saprospiraceae bacterium]|nr:T9SS type A sorting domain-containing protein [Saprospiraceae bacterium]